MPPTKDDVSKEAVKQEGTKAQRGRQEIAHYAADAG
jgi:hypothetical protein